MDVLVYKTLTRHTFFRPLINSSTNYIVRLQQVLQLILDQNLKPFASGCISVVRVLCLRFGCGWCRRV
jgi:hypothetical protein